MNKKLKSVRQLFNQYGNDQELDFLTLVYERDTGRMMAENENTSPSQITSRIKTLEVDF